jgi:hypothetical protein
LIKAIALTPKFEVKMFSISWNLKQGVDRLSINKWLMGLLVAIPIAGIGCYVAYNQLLKYSPA